jgi:DNA invertase Pin-like site-specific DNA recombinase
VGAPPIVAGYIRVSSRGQDYEYQRVAIERAARARGEVIHRWYADVASGRTMERPQLRRLREAARQGAIQRLWVWRIDRLTRSGILDTLAAIASMRKAGCLVTSVADGFALDGPASDVVLAVLAWAAQMEREKIRENQAAARARMALEGRPWGRPRVSENVRERIHELRRDQKLSVAKIARTVNVSKTTAWNVLQETG